MSSQTVKTTVLPWTSSGYQQDEFNGSSSSPVSIGMTSSPSLHSGMSSGPVLQRWASVRVKRMTVTPHAVQELTNKDLGLTLNVKLGLEMLFVLLLQPFSVLYVLQRYGMQTARNLHLLPPVPFLRLVTVISWAFVLVFPIVYYSLGLNWPGFKQMWVLALTYGLVLEASVALKFAHMPGFLVTKALFSDTHVSQEASARESLIQGWRDLQADGIVQELEIAAIQLNVDLAHESVMVNKRNSNMAADVLRTAGNLISLNDAIIPVGDSIKIPLLPLCVALVLSARSGLSSRAGNVLCFAIASMHVAHAVWWTVDINSQYTSSSPDQQPWYQWACLAVLALHTFMQCLSAVTKLLVAVADMQRRYYCLRALRIATHTEQFHANNLDGNLTSQSNQQQWFDVLDARNATVWYHCGLLMSELGARFLMRLQAYLSVVSVVVFGLVISIVVENLTSAPTLAQRMYTQLVLSIAVCVFVAVIITMLFGAMANRENNLAIQVCAEARRAVFARTIGLLKDSEERVASETAAHVLEAIQNAIQVRCNTQPFRVLGFRAEVTTVQRIFGLLASVISIGISYFPSPV